MAKSKRKISAAQQDKTNIAIAKKLKKAGIISKQAKLNQGRFISAGVLRKVRVFQDSADLNYRAAKVPKALAQAAKERGFQVVQGNRIIGPNTPQFRARLNKGELTGVRPVKGGMMEEVILPYNVYDMRTLIDQLQDGIDSLKMPDEQFAFKYFGNESYRAFLNTKQMLDYLQHYKAINGVIQNEIRPEEVQEQFEAFTIFRLHPNDIRRFIRGPERRKKDKKANASGRSTGQVVRRTTRQRRLEELSNRNLAAMRKKEAKKTKAYRQALQSDPIKLAEYRAKAAARAKASRDSKKGK